ncbi:MAG: phage baseplate protein, partial [Candidatus Saccharimonadales bacterium]
TPNPLLDFTHPPISTWVMVLYNLGGWFFDNVLSAQHTLQLTVTSDPIQLGSSISDYAYVQPRQLVLQIGQTDTATSFIPGQFAGGKSRSVNAYQVLKALAFQRIPVQVTTRLETYQNMIVQEVQATEDNTTASALNATVTLQEILVATVQAIKVSTNPSVTGSSSSGAKAPQALSQGQQSYFQIVTGIAPPA